ncbi:hypothetical protein D3C71_1615520 [compost metagenome]
MVLEDQAASSRQAAHQHLQLERIRRTQGDAQLGRSQDRQQAGTVSVVALYQQNAECAYVLGPTCGDQQALDQQLQ